MNFLLDTNVIVEPVKPQPHLRVLTWLSNVDEDRLFLSVATLAEIRNGVETMTDGRRRNRLAAWLADDLPVRFEGRIVGIDQQIAQGWGIITARCKRAGTPIGTMDAFFAATAHAYGLTLVTRDVRDFKATGIELFDPWHTP